MGMPERETMTGTSFWEQEVERIYEIAVVVLAEIAQDARIELLLRKRGLEVDDDFISPPLHLTHMRARGEYHRARHAEMCKQHLTEIGIDVLSRFVSSTVIETFLSDSP